MPGSRANEHTYGHATVDAKTATTTSGILLAANRARRYAAFVNNGAVDVFLAMGIRAESTKGITLKANGGSYEMNATNLTPLVVNCITASATASVSVLEGT